MHYACRGKHLEIAKLLLDHMSLEAALTLNEVSMKLIKSYRFAPSEYLQGTNPLLTQDGLSAIQVWGRDKEQDKEEDDEATGSRDAGEDDKEALAAYIDALFDDTSLK